MKGGCVTPVHFPNEVWLHLILQPHLSVFQSGAFLSVKNTEDQHVLLLTVDPMTLLPGSQQFLGPAPAHLSSGPKLSRIQSKFSPKRGGE